MMAKKENLRKKLNLTQADMAMILNISRSQWALYELGLRDLSAAALIRLNQIENFFLTKDVDLSKHAGKFEEQERIKAKWLAWAVKENEYRQLTDRLKRDFEAVMDQLTLIDFLSEPADEKDALHPGAIAILKEKAYKAFDKNSPLQLLKLELQQKKLQQESVLLNASLKGPVQ
ncbi:helix-turn-helix domain-containing protein [Flavobacterium sp. XGLA_31]|uniref:helix-turn-helix domain-containing protein n=1 Tax=Flavobacterium sp. XGLA_31 TaxID=3447666 RepID=UPI003F37D896